MVFLTRLSFSVKRQFIDRLRLNVCGGRGGQGLAKYGGLGGRGGNIYLVGDKEAQLKDIKQLNPSQKFQASNGHNSSSHSLQGGPGEDILIRCPLGISVVTDQKITLAEINKNDEKVLIAKGGKGGSPANNFLGEKGHQHNLNLDLKLIADIGLVGFPNAGKSTLLKSLSRASPKIASYPFTTIEPRIAMLEYPDKRQITMADLPGLIEGAHVNVGMGHKFLKHVERTKMLLFIVDIFGFRLNPQYPLRSSFENILLLNRELELYKEELVSKPSVLVINKIDIPESDVRLKELMDNLENMQESMTKVDESLRPTNLVHFDDILTISAKMQNGTGVLKERLRELLDYHHKKELEREEQEKEEEQANYFKLTNTEHINVKFV